MLTLLIDILYSKSTAMEPVGGHMRHCPDCGQLQPHFLQRVIQRERIFVHFREVPLHLVSQCEVCHSVGEYSRKHEVFHLERWSAEVDIVGYAVDCGCDELDEDYAVMTERSAHAMLKSVSGTTAAKMNLGWRDYADAFLYFLLFGVVGMWLFVRSGQSDAGLPLLLIPFAGVLFALFSLVYRRKKATYQNEQLKDLSDRMARLGIGLDELRGLLPADVRAGGRVRELLHLIR